MGLLAKLFMLTVNNVLISHPFFLFFMPLVNLYTKCCCSHTMRNHVSNEKPVSLIFFWDRDDSHCIHCNCTKFMTPSEHLKKFGSTC